MTTKYQEEKDRNDRLTYDLYMELTTGLDMPKSMAVREVMRRRHIHSPSTVYEIRKRVERKLAAEGGGL